MSSDFTRVFRNVLLRRASNAIINKTIDEVSRRSANYKADLVEKGYIIPSLKTVFTYLFFYGWIMVVPYLFVSFIILAGRWYTAEIVFTVLCFLLYAFLYFEGMIVYKKRLEPVFKKDMRFKTGQRHISDNVVDDEESAMPIPHKALVYKYICNSIVMLYFLVGGLPLSYELSKWFKDEGNKPKTEQMKSDSVKDSLRRVDE